MAESNRVAPRDTAHALRAQNTEPPATRDPSPLQDGRTVSTDDIKAFAEWAANAGNYPREIAYRPARVLMQDFTGVPAVVDLAAMRDGVVALGGSLALFWVLVVRDVLEYGLWDFFMLVGFVGAYTHLALPLLSEFIKILVSHQRESSKLSDEIDADAATAEAPDVTERAA